jgi:drug/metabolite transporter (DMT)-like permease
MKKYLLLTVIALLWGGQFVFMFQAIESLPPSFVAAGRALTGAVTLWIVCLLMKTETKPINWRLYLGLGFVEAALPFILLAWAQQFVDSSVSSVIMGMIPLMTLLFAPLLIASERLTIWKMASVVIGFVGILVLFAPGLMASDAGLPLLPLLMILISAACYALGMLMVKRWASDAPLVVARNILIAATPQLLLVCLVQQPSLEAMGDVSMTALWGMLMLGVFSTGFAYYAFMSLIALSGPTFASMSNYLIPVVGFIMGGLVLGEKLAANTGWALLLILAAVAVNQFGGRRLNSEVKISLS